MKLKFTLPQMIERWLQIRRLNTAPLSASVTRTDGVDIEQLVAEEIRSWYYRLLVNADIKYLSPVDIASAVTATSTDGFSAEVIIPASVVRVVRVRADSWRLDGTIITDPSSPMVTRQTSPLTVSSPQSPVVFYHSNILNLYPFTPGDTLKTLQVVTFDDNVFEFDSLALTTILPYDSDFSF